MSTYESHMEYLIQLARDAMYDDRFDEALNLLESGLLEEPGYPKLHAVMGDLYSLHLDNPELAERHYLLTIKFDPKYWEAYVDLADLYQEHQKYEGIKKIMHQATQVKELDKAEAFERIGIAEERQGRYTEAIDFFKRSLLESVDNDSTQELKKHIKRNRYKRFKQRWKRA